MPQAIGHEEAWQAVTFSVKAIKTIDGIGVEAAVARIRARGGSPRRIPPRSHEVVLLIVPPSWADSLPAPVTRRNHGPAVCRQQPRPLRGALVRGQGVTEHGGSSRGAALSCSSHRARFLARWQRLGWLDDRFKGLAAREGRGRPTSVCEARVGHTRDCTLCENRRPAEGVSASRAIAAGRGDRPAANRRRAGHTGDAAGHARLHL